MNPNNPFDRVQGNDQNTFDPFARTPQQPSFGTEAAPANMGYNPSMGPNYFANFMRPPFTGKYVGDPGEIMVRDIPTDGSLALFPTRDLSTIYAKAWNSNGKIVTVKYIADPSQFETPSQNSAPDMSNILERLEALEKGLMASNAKSGGNRKQKEDAVNG